MKKVIIMQNEKYIHCTLIMYETKFKLFLEPLKKYANNKESILFVDSFAKIENEFVHMKSSFEIFEYQDILEMRDRITQFLLGDCDKAHRLSFTEPDLEFVFPKLNSDEEPYVELRLYPCLGGFTNEYYALELDGDKLNQLRYFLDYCLNADDKHKTWYTVSGRPISYRFYSQSQQENTKLKQKLDVLFEACLKCWDEISVFPPCREDETFQLEVDPSYGQSAVTAMLVREFVGGDVYRIRTDKQMTHYFNYIDGHLVDLCADQFALYNLPLAYVEAEFMPNQPEKLSENTQYRYRHLKKKVEKILSKNK